MQANPKIALIGCSNVAPASAYSLLNGPVGIDLYLIGEGAEQLLESVAALLSDLPTHQESTIRLGYRSELDDAKICVLSAGSPPTADDTEESFLLRNIDIVREQGELLREAAFNGVLIVTTNPAEIMAQAAMESSGLDGGSVVGISPATASLMKNERTSLPLATWCSASGCGTEFIDSCHPDCPYFENMLDRFHRHQQTVGDSRPATMAACVMRVCEAILSDEKSVLPVAVMLNGEYAIMGTFSTLPCVIGKHGVERILEFPLSESEHKSLLDTARDTGRLFYRLTKKASVMAGGRPA
jgi:L-lactate dehydrogenase